MSETFTGADPLPIKDSSYARGFNDGYDRHAAELREQGKVIVDRERPQAGYVTVRRDDLHTVLGLPHDPSWSKSQAAREAYARLCAIEETYPEDGS